MNTPQFDLGTMLSAPQTAIQQIPCDQLHPYHNHKFELYSGERLEDMVASIKENGVLSPIIVQPIEGGYEILIGHNRWNASKLAGLPTVPAIVKTGLTEEEAEMYVIESNVMQRGFENLRISEQAAAVALRHSEMFSQGKRNDILRELAVLENPSAEPDTATLNPVGSKLDTNESVGKEYGVSKGSVVRLIRINKLIDAINAIPGVNIGNVSEIGQFGGTNFAGAVDAAIAGLEAMQNVKPETITLERFDTDGLIEGFVNGGQAGADWAKGVREGMAGQTDFGDFKDLLKGIDANTANAIPNGTGKVGKVGKVDNVKLSDEDLKVYRDLAERRYMNNIELKTLAPEINVTLPAGASGNLSAQDVADKLKRMLIEQMAAQTSVAHAY